MDGGAWWVAVHGVNKSQTRLSDFTFTFHFYALENTFESLLDCKEIKQSFLEEINPDYSLEGLTDAEAPIFWLPDTKKQLIRKDPDAGKD